MKCEHKTLACENPKIIFENYRESIEVEYIERCEDCGKKVGKEKVVYEYRG